MKSPSWHRDEIILALDLYHSLDPKDITKSNRKVIELSNLLKKLPIHDESVKNKKFRNTNGVHLKLSNFKAIDPDFDGKGMSSFSKLDEAVFFEFKDRKEVLKSIASKIRNTAIDNELNKKLNDIKDEEDEEDYFAKEGKVIYKLHRLRERNHNINRIKKKRYFDKHGKLDCEVCGFDFYKTYGEIGKDFIEAHHRVPLSELDIESITKLEDLALVCSNCHRMLHRSISIADLKNALK